MHIFLGFLRLFFVMCQIFGSENPCIAEFLKSARAIVLPLLLGP